MSRWGKRMARDFDVDAYLTRLHGESRRGPISKPSPAKLTVSRETFDEFVELCAAHGLPRPVRQYVFHPVRKWRFDYAWVVNRVAVEMDGGLWSGNEQAKAAHAKPLGILRDMEKGNAAQLYGWRVLRYTPEQLQSEAIRDLKIMFADRPDGG